MRQFAYTYRLPARVFPLVLPLGGGADVLEVLLEEPAATAAGANLQEVDPVSAQGRTFKRYLAQNAPANSVVRIVAPAAVEHTGASYRVWLAGAIGALMLAALVLTVVRRTPRRVPVAFAPPAPPVTTRASDSLLRELATLDASFERVPSPSAEERSRYDAERAALKSRVAAALAEERRRS
jgi:hypothetical protein